MKPHGTRALVTGGSTGIGLAYAEALAAHGCSVALIHRGDSIRAGTHCTRWSGLYPDGKFVDFDVDLGDATAARHAVAKAADALGGLDIAVSNAGICQFTPFLEIDVASWERHLAVNFSAGFHVGQSAARIMRDQGSGGRIVFTTSVGARRSNATQTHYCATKGGLQVLAQGMALELACFGITVNCIAPGWIHTEINDAASRDTAAVESWLKSRCAVGRLGTPRDLGSAILLLCAADSGYITGSTVTVDGGWDAQL